MSNRIYKHIVIIICLTLFAGVLTACSAPESKTSAPSTSASAPSTSASAPSALAKQIELKWFQSEPEEHPWTQVGYLIAKEIEEKSNGEFKITTYAGASLGSEAEGLSMLRDGSIALFTSGPSILASFYDPVQIVSLPYIFDSKEDAYKYFNSDAGQKVFNDIILKASGVRTLDVWYFGDRHLTTKGVAAKKPEDLKGVKVRCMDSPVAKTVVAGLGANPVPINFSELYMGLQTGVVAGQENPIPTIIASKFFEVQDHINLTGHNVHVGSVHVNEKQWQSFSDAQRKVITDAFAKFKPEIDKRIIEAMDSGLEELKAKGMTIVEPDIEAFKENAKKEIDKAYGNNELWQKEIAALRDAVK